MAKKNNISKRDVFLPTLVFCFLYTAFSSFLINTYYNISLSEPVVFAQEKKTLGVATEIEVSQPTKPSIIIETVEPILSAASAYAIDPMSGYVLYEKNPNEPVFPASTAKIITALVALDYYDIKSIAVVGSEVAVEGQKMGLVESEEITIENLLYGLLVLSANDAAEVLAANYPGGRDIFVAQMNVMARDIGMQNTIFTNPSGLDSASQTTTAKDLIIAAEEAMKNDIFTRIVATKEIVVESAGGEYRHRLSNINRLLWEVDGVKGVKTGKTDGARENLVTYVERNGSGVYIAVLGSADRFNDSIKLIEHIFVKYSFD